MRLYKIAHTTYRFDGAIGALVKVGTRKDLGSHELVTPQLSENAMIEGRPQVSRSELFHIGKKDANLNEDDVKRLHNIRNGYDSHESFLQDHPYYSGQDQESDPSELYYGSHTLYHSPNIRMNRSVGKGLDHSEIEHLGRDEIEITVGGRYTRSQDDSKKHIKELGNVTRAFQHFTDYPSGKRAFVAHPSGTKKEEKDSKAALYRKMGGFSPLGAKIHPDQDSEDAAMNLFANHGSSDSSKDHHNKLYKKHFSLPNSEQGTSMDMPSDEDAMLRQIAAARRVMGL